jgi:4-alpha-glucanotransferase
MSVLATRRAGVLLHPTSLPGPHGAGTLGADAWRFVDWLAAAGFSVWQTLPLGPADAHGSPYCLSSAYAGDVRLLDPEHLASLRALPAGLELGALGREPVALYRSFVAQASAKQQRAFAEFARGRRHRLLPYGLFRVCTQRFGGAPWWHWPDEFRLRRSSPIRKFLAGHQEPFRAALFEQYLFALQWSALKRYANDRGVLLFGDLPFYVDLNSVEVWWQPELFSLDAGGRPTAVAGVPPDYFNADGQLWGNPLYDWDAMAQRGFDWWLARFAAQLERFDLLRIDHFRALESYWQVPAGADTARNGEWRAAPGDALLAAVRRQLGDVPLVAEDLGLITDEVRALRDRFELPGMVVLQFGFDGKADNPHLPANHRENAVVYTGTHDNDTTAGWYESLDAGTRAYVREVLAPIAEVGANARPHELLAAAAYASRARLAVVPLQDLLGLGSQSRMNTPGTTLDNWRWRFDWSQMPSDLAACSRRRLAETGRAPA